MEEAIQESQPSNERGEAEDTEESWRECVPFVGS